MIKRCEDCGKEIGTTYIVCSDCYTARKIKNAKKVKFKDYGGDIIYNDELHSNGEFESLYREEFTKDSPKMIFATKIGYSIGLDIEEELRTRAQENGYEDMDEVLDFGSDLLQKAQELIDKWVEEQGTRGNSYTEDMNTAIDLTELYEEEISKTQEDLIKEAVENEHGRGIVITDDVLETIVEYTKEKDREFIIETVENMTRVCSKCNSIMLKGYVENDGDEYYCSKNCLLNEYDTEEDFFGTEEEQNKMENKGYANPNYWTDWGLGQDYESEGKNNGNT